jgi:hypothetical protein
MDAAGAGPAQPDRDEILRGLRTLFRRGDVVEVRALEARWERRDGVIISGYFDRAEPLADAVLPIEADGVYTSLQLVDSRCLARRVNRLAPAGKTPTTADADILRYRYLPIDIDPARPSGVSSRDDEHEAALGLAARIADDMEAHGWPTPGLADSGNGGHVLVSIDLAPTDRPLVEATLKAIAARYATAALRIDTSCANPARIWKLYGTVAKKGEHRPDQPHRLARLLRAPCREPVPRDWLEAFVAAAGHPTHRAAAPSPGQPERHDPDAFHAFLTRRGLAIAREKAEPDGRHVFVIDCPFEASHGATANVTLFPNGNVSASCFHQSCAWNWPALSAKFEKEKP